MLQAGESDPLALGGIGCLLPFVVRAADTAGTHVQFVLDAKASAMLTPLLDGLQRQRQAA
ncbi:MAG: hypothetical protein J0H67_20630 [Rhodospirillales bacterium]|nr:hypothetical protein [Rhodospirillales bacterium]